MQYSQYLELQLYPNFGTLTILHVDVNLERLFMNDKTVLEALHKSRNISASLQMRSNWTTARFYPIGVNQSDGLMSEDMGGLCDYLFVHINHSFAPQPARIFRMPSYQRLCVGGVYGKTPYKITLVNEIDNDEIKLNDETSIYPPRYFIGQMTVKGIIVRASDYRLRLESIVGDGYKICEFMPVYFVLDENSDTIIVPEKEIKLIEYEWTL